MQKLSDVGVFWILGHEEDELSGSLTFEPDSGTVLKVVGRFDHYGESDVLTIHGWIGSKKISLIGGFQQDQSFPAPGIGYEEYYSNTLYIGHHLDPADLNFRSVAVEFSNLAHWVLDSGITEADFDDGEAHVVVRQTPEKSVEMNGGGVLTLAFRPCHVRKGVEGNTYRQEPYFRIDYSSAQSFEAIESDVSRIQTLLTLCMDTPIQLDKFTLKRPDVTVQMLDGSFTPFPQEIEYRAALLRHVPAEDRVPQPVHRMLLPFETFGGVAAVGRWIERSEPFQRILNSMVSPKRVRQMFAENQFLNVTFAAEAFHRIIDPSPHMPPEDFDKLLSEFRVVTPENEREWLQDKLTYANDAPLGKRLRALARRSAPATKSLVLNKDHWAYAVAQLRNYLTHIGRAEMDFDSGDVIFLTESVYSVLRVCILLECGLDAAVLPKLLNSPAHWFGARVTSGVERIRSQFLQRRSTSAP